MRALALPKRAAAEPTPFMAFVADDAHGRVIADAAREAGFRDPAVVAATGREVIRRLGEMPTPRHLVVDVSGAADPLAELAALAEVCDGGTRLVLLGEVNDVDVYRRMLAAGVDDYLVKPVAPEVVLSVLKGLAETPETGGEGGGEAEIIAVVGACGGTGASTVAVNMAWLFAHEAGSRTALVDLDLYFGTCALALDLETGRGFREALENPERIDSLFIERAMVGESENLFVLATEDDLEKARSFDPEALRVLVEHLRRDFRTIVFDLPRFAARKQIVLFEPPVTVILVADASLAGMRDTRRLMSVLKADAPRANLKVVLNRVGMLKGGELSRSDFEAGAEVKVEGVVPFDDKAVAASCGAGQPLVQVAPKSKSTQALRRLVGELCPIGREAVTPSLWARALRFRR